METTYAMIGSDGQQYGPVTLAQIKTWVLEGRIGADTKVWRSDTNSWLPAAQYVELGLGQAAPSVIRAPSVIQAPAADIRDPMLERRARSGALWFFWIAGLSLVNTFTIGSSGHGGVFLVGLASTAFIKGFARGLGPQWQGFGIGLSVAVAALFVVFGFFAGKRQSWSYIAGMVLYGLDAVLVVGLAVMLSAHTDIWLMAAFHVLVLVWIFRGWQASIQLKNTSPGGPA